MGVRVDPIDEAVEAPLEALTAEVPLAGEVAAAASRYVLDGRQNASFKAVNLLIDAGIEVRRVDAAPSGLRPGDFLVPPGSEATLEEVARATGVDFAASSTIPSRDHEVRQMRVGMYQRYWGGNMDEGWTRFTLEMFAFPYTSLMDDVIKKGDLRASYDVIILPHDQTGTIMGKPETRPGRPEPVYPPEYRSGIGEEGLDALVPKYIARLSNDPWGNPYLSLSPGLHGDMDVYTLGADGLQGGTGINADVGNWNVEQ